MFKNLTWSAAAKFYISVVGLAATYAASQSDLPGWVAPVLAVATAIATWAKSQQPVTQ